MRILKIVFICLAVVFVLVQFVRIDRSNPPVDQARTIESVVNVPADIQQIMSRSCNDCHTHKTIYPWYTNVAPVSWWLRDHIDHGREHLNMSEYGGYTTRQQEHKLEEICEQVEAGLMPLPSYLIMHRDAALSGDEKKAICNWTNTERAKFPKETQ
jgi:hypothetical protein